jgi:hypothetical protein
MAKVSKEVLKSFFQTGSRPNGAHYASLIDSLMHYSDRGIMGLKTYDPARVYAAGDTVIYNAAVYQALIQTTGAFIVQDWSKVISGSVTDFGADYEMAESLGQSFMTSSAAFTTKLILNTGSRRGRYRLQWGAVANHQIDGGMGMFRLFNTNSGQVIGSVLSLHMANMTVKLPLGGFATIDLDGNSQRLELQYQTLNNGMRQNIEQARIEIFKITSLG